MLNRKEELFRALNDLIASASSIDDAYARGWSAGLESAKTMIDIWILDEEKV